MRALDVKRDDSVAEKRMYYFANGYGASVVCTPYSYGGSHGLWELAVLKHDGDDWPLCYDTSIANDVIGWLSWEEVDAMLVEIVKLPKKGA